MTIKEDLEVIGEAALKYGMSRVEINGLMAVEFTYKPPQVVYPTAMATSPIGESEGMPTDDQLLFASSIPLTDEEIAAQVPE